MPMPHDPSPEDMEMLRVVWREEDEKRTSMEVGFVVQECLLSDNPRVVRAARQYHAGILTYAEFEARVREVYDRCQRT